MRFAEICRTAVAEYARRLAWDVGCGSYVVVAQGRRGPQASCRINGTQGKTAASGDSCSRNWRYFRKAAVVRLARSWKMSRVRVCSLSCTRKWTK